MPFTSRLALALTLSVLASTPALSSDHIDGEVTKSHPLCDLADLYAFPTPDRPGWLTLALTTHPFASKRNHFSSKVDYRITLRQVALDPAGKTLTTDPSSERVLTFRFDDAVEPHTMTVHAGDRARTVEFQAVDPTCVDGLRVFAGRRADPFFLDVFWSNAAINKHKLRKRGGIDAMAGMHVLAMVVDVDLAALYGHDDVGVLGVVGESLDAETGERFDRVGRPESTNVSLVAHDDEPELRDRFNTELAPFAFDPAGLGDYVARLRKNVAYYDALDDQRDWTPAAAQAYAELIARDALLVAPGLPQGPGEAYFAIEEALLAGRAPRFAGGRLLTDHAMVFVLSRLITNGRERLDDGVDGPWEEPTQSFPYLAAPRFTLLGWAKITLSRRTSGIPGRAYEQKPRRGFIHRLFQGGEDDHDDGGHDHDHDDDHGHDHDHDHGHDHDH